MITVIFTSLQHLFADRYVDFIRQITHRPGRQLVRLVPLPLRDHLQRDSLLPEPDQLRHPAEVRTERWKRRWPV